MATTLWVGGGITQTQLETVTVTAVNAGDAITATIGIHTISYTPIGGDTPTTAATALYNKLVAAGVYPEFAELTFANPSAGVITVTIGTSGTPFTITFTAAGASAPSS